MSKSALSEEWMPLTLPQLDFWEEFRFNPDEPVSTVAHYLEIEGDVDESALLRAILQTIEEAEVLSIRFQATEKRTDPRQICDPKMRPELQFEDLRQSGDPMKEALKRMHADLGAPLDLCLDRLSAQSVYRVSQNRYLWYLRAHHIIIDGYGLSLIEKRCGQLYGYYSAGLEAGEPFHRFAQFIEEDISYQAGKRRISDRNYWLEYLAQAQNLPVLLRDEEEGGPEGLYSCDSLPAELSAELRKCAAEMQVGWPDLLVLISSLYLRNILSNSNDEATQDFIVWLPFMSRWGSIGAHVPAMLVNILPFRVPIARGVSMTEFLKTGASDLRRQRRYGRYRIEQIAEDQNLAADSRFFFSPLINVLPFSAPDFAGCITSRNVLASGPADGFNVTFRADEDGDNLTLEMDADPAMTSPEMLERYRRDLPQFLIHALGNMDGADDILPRPDSVANLARA